MTRLHHFNRFPERLLLLTFYFDTFCAVFTSPCSIFSISHVSETPDKHDPVQEGQTVVDRVRLGGESTV